MSSREEYLELKSKLMDLFFQVYGSRLAQALRLEAARSKGSAKGGKTMQSKSRNSSIKAEIARLRAAGKPERAIAKLVALNIRVSEQYVRRVRKKTKQH